jgi:hypothetical protein
VPFLVATTDIQRAMEELSRMEVAEEPWVDMAAWHPPPLLTVTPTLAFSSHKVAITGAWHPVECHLLLTMADMARRHLSSRRPSVLPRLGMVGPSIVPMAVVRDSLPPIQESFLEVPPTTEAPPQDPRPMTIAPSLRGTPMPPPCKCVRNSNSTPTVGPPWLLLLRATEALHTVCTVEHRVFLLLPLGLQTEDTCLEAAAQRLHNSRLTPETRATTALTAVRVPPPAVWIAVTDPIR